MRDTVHTIYWFKIIVDTIKTCNLNHFNENAYFFFKELTYLYSSSTANTKELLQTPPLKSSIVLQEFFWTFMPAV